jgi:hypothetical protein
MLYVCVYICNKYIVFHSKITYFSHIRNIHSQVGQMGGMALLINLFAKVLIQEKWGETAL